MAMTIRFYDVKGEPYGAFSNFSKHPFTLDRVWYPTAEHAFQAAKFAGLPQAETIRAMRGAKDAARKARELRKFVRADWDAVKEIELRRILLAKFTAHGEARDLLISTDDEPIEFASPMDDYWGVGRDGDGQNRFGRILELVRIIVRKHRDAIDAAGPSIAEAEGSQDQGPDVGGGRVRPDA
jgi:N-glycosidase YbiA